MNQYKNEMDALNQYLEKWSLSQPTPIAETATSYVYKVEYKGAPAILKLLTAIGKKFEASSASVLKCFDGNGAVEVFHSDEGALLLEYIDGPKLSMKVESGQDADAGKIICDVLDDLHSYSGPIPENTHNLARQFKSLFDRAKLEDAPETYVRTAKVAQELIDTECNKVLLHGDIHHTNILENSERGWVAIDPQSFFGERTYDIANAFFNPDNMPEVVENKDRIMAMATIFAKRLSVDENRILKFAYAHGGLSSSWQVDDGENPKRRLRITSIIESLI